MPVDSWRLLSFSEKRLSSIGACDFSIGLLNASQAAGDCVAWMTSSGSTSTDSSGGMMVVALDHRIATTFQPNCRRLTTQPVSPAIRIEFKANAPAAGRRFDEPKANLPKMISVVESRFLGDRVGH